MKPAKKTILDPEQVRHIADLAQLELNETEQQAVLENLNDILNYFQMIDQVDTLTMDSRDPAHSQRAALMEDKTHAELKNFPQDNLRVEDALANAPDQSDGQIRIPAFLGET